MHEMPIYATLQDQKFVHVVATVDLARQQGAIRYVNPATIGTVSDMPGHPAVEMSVESRDGAQKKTWHPVVRFASSEGGEPPSAGLIQEDIAAAPWMCIVRLFVKGKEVATYEGAAADALRAAAPAAAPGAGLALEPVGEGGNKRRLRITDAVPKQAGLTYTIQVRPAGTTAWHTIATGRETPDVQVDRNQFPGARRVGVRVIQTTGFQERVIAEDEIDLAPE
jgi:hypothetical protein